MIRTFTLRFEMLSDWHIGAGFGRPGSVDRLLLRDTDDLPFLPAKTVRGMWRDAAERVAAALGDGWDQVVDAVFGDQPAQTEEAREARPRETALIVTPARLPAGLRAKLRKQAGESVGRAELRAAVAFVKPGVKIDPDSGRAADDFLRFEEVARAGAVLTATATFDPVRAGHPAAEHLLLAATRLVTRVGGKRRRGNGRCTVTVSGADVRAAIDRLEAATPATSVPAVAGTGTDDSPVTAAGDGWEEFPFALTLRGPAAVAARTVGNVVESLDFIPGTYLLGHVTRHFPTLRPAVARGDVVVTNATRDVGGAAGRPVPFALFAPKGKGFADRAEVVNGLLKNVAGLKQFRGGYVGSGALVPVAATVATTVRTHNVIKDEPQRPTTDVGGVYSYEGIAPAVFRGSILAKSGLLPATAPTRLTCEHLRLGSSKKDDYGEAALTVFPPAAPVAPPARAGELVVWLLSDVLLRDAALRPAPTVDALRLALQSAFKTAGAEVALKVVQEENDVRPDEPEMFRPIKAFARQRRTESWHTGWGLPRPSLVGLQAGTCVRFTVTGERTGPALAAVAIAGVGERTAEGYGRVAFNHPLLTTDPKIWTNDGFAAVEGELAPEKPDHDPETADAFAAVIEAAAWKSTIRTAALHATDTAEKRNILFGWEIPGPGESRPTLSQLGGLRAVLPFFRSKGEAKAETALQAEAKPVTDWLDAVKKNPRRDDKWPKERAGRPAALDLTRSWFTVTAKVWSTLREQGVEFPTLGAATTPEAELWAFAVRALVDAGIRAHKRDTERRTGEASRGT